MNKPKVVVIGLDGSSWDLVNLMMAEGRLPNLKTMQTKGMSSTLESTHPAHSAPAWTSFATGLYPTQHGCLDFLVVNNDLTDVDIIDSTKITSETIYETMVRHGRKPILINLPNTFPPKLKSEITITSLMTRGDKYIYPESLKAKYPALQNYRLSPNAKLRSTNNFTPYVEDLCRLEQERIAGAKELFSNEPWDFFFFLSSGTDWVSHVVYDKALREHYQPAWKMWDIMDDFIGWIMQQMDADTTLLVMSDHGFKVYDEIFYLNRWLEEQGYLATTSGTGSFQASHTKLSREIETMQGKRTQIKVGKGLRNVLKSSVWLERAAKWFYHHIFKRFVPVNVTIDLTLDLAKTKIGFPRGSMASMLYINDRGRFKNGIVPAEQRTGLRDELVSKLQPLVEEVLTAETVYGDAPLLPNSPDLFISSDKYYLSGSLHSAALYEKTTKNYHDKRGMFLAYGQAIDHRTMPTSSIMQMAPTIMQAMSLPVQQQHRGQPMDIFKPTSPLHQPSQREQATEQYALKQLVADIDL
ncbi:MAG: alkaline phosphatase family protein [Candidatus Kerfeldbacteria bacterium]|nr:alkaline phosphatase family protein [Candidatus Kerfeldbacteria bacterium]